MILTFCRYTELEGLDLDDEAEDEEEPEAAVARELPEDLPVWSVPNLKKNPDLKGELPPAQPPRAWEVLAFDAAQVQRILIALTELLSQEQYVQYHRLQTNALAAIAFFFCGRFPVRNGACKAFCFTRLQSTTSLGYGIAYTMRKMQKSQPNSSLRSKATGFSY